MRCVLQLPGWVRVHKTKHWVFVPLSGVLGERHQPWNTFLEIPIHVAQRMPNLRALSTCTYPKFNAYHSLVVGALSAPDPSNVGNLLMALVPFDHSIIVSPSRARVTGNAQVEWMFFLFFFLFRSLLRPLCVYCNIQVITTFDLPRTSKSALYKPLYFDLRNYSLALAPNT